MLYDAMILLLSEKGAETLVRVSAARDFVVDAFTHMKFIGYVTAAMPLIEKAGISDSLDKAYIHLEKGEDVSRCVEACRKNGRYYFIMVDM